MRVIALSGWKGSGKDTVALYLKDKYGAKQISFAGPLKDMASKEFDVPREWFDDINFKEKPLLKYPVNPKDDFGKSIALFMAKEFRTEWGFTPMGGTVAHGDFLGQIVVEDGFYRYQPVFWTPRALAILKGSTCRAVDTEYWVEQAISEIKNNKENELFVISDMRYKSEALQLKESFKDNLITVRIDRFNESVSTDPSERDLDDYSFDCRIHNLSTKEELFSETERVLRKVPK